MPLLRSALDEVARKQQPRVDSVGSRHAVPSSPPAPINVILESNTLLQFLKPDLFLMVLHPAKSDFKDSAKLQLNHATAFVLREPIPSNPTATTNGDDTTPSWQNIPLQLLRTKPNFLHIENSPLPVPLLELVRNLVCTQPKVPGING